MVAIAADSLDDMTKLQGQLPRLTLLTDVDKKALPSWGLLKPGADEPEPGTFVVRSDGTIAYRRLEIPGHGDWPTYAELLAAVDAAK